MKKCLSLFFLFFYQTVTLGSQEGAFENVRMNYSGDQGQAIRQLITAHMVRRVAMCVLASPHGKRQHLAVSHEKGKITILQLSALLKQADSSKKKLTLTVSTSYVYCLFRHFYLHTHIPMCIEFKAKPHAIFTYLHFLKCKIFSY